MSKRPSSSSPPGSGPSSPKRKPPTLHSWLHPEEPAPLLAHSPPLHAITSTFTSITLQFEPPTHITTIAALTRECQRRVRELDVPGLVGGEAMEKGEGAFADGEGRAPGRKGKERAREPDHRMWAVRCICLKEGKNGTGGEDDYQVSREWGASDLDLADSSSYWRHSTTTERSMEGSGCCGYCKSRKASTSLQSVVDG